MPPAISDDEDASSLPGITTMPVMAKRGKKPVDYSDKMEPDEDVDEDDEIDKVKGDIHGDADEEDEEDSGDEEDDGLEEDEYVVEKIMNHIVEADGAIRFEVKWEGFEKKADRTWEPEENLRENASQVLDDYLKRIGGRERLFDETAKALTGKKRGRPPTRTPTGTPSSTPGASNGHKRQRKNGTDGTDGTNGTNGINSAGPHPAESSPPLSGRRKADRDDEDKWHPPPGSWEEQVESVDACQDEESGNLIVYLTWRNGKKTQHPTAQVYKRCPQHMLRFYERCIRIVRSEEDKDRTVVTSRA